MPQNSTFLTCSFLQFLELTENLDRFLIHYLNALKIKIGIQFFGGFFWGIELDYIELLYSPMRIGFTQRSFEFQIFSSLTYSFLKRRSLKLIQLSISSFIHFFILINYFLHIKISRNCC